MMTSRSTRGILLTAAVLVVLAAACAGGVTGSASSGETWGDNQVQPADLVTELANATGADKPTVVCVGPPFLYRAAHVPGAVLHGPMTSPSVIDEFTAWAKTLPPAANLVVYCGCCPMEVCPNVRPAYKILKDLGFTRVRVLILPTNFATDWVGRGFPVDK
jgi:poly(3-hydroxybutyrate) depolymerase